LRGVLPASLKDFTALEKLDLSQNKLTGLVPPLPWAQYTGGCSIQARTKYFVPSADRRSTIRTNFFASPLPPNSDQCAGGAPTCAGPPTPGTTCNGSAYSAALPLAECSAWQDFFDATNGAQWADCNATRLDPCACLPVNTTRGDQQNQGVSCAGGHITDLFMRGNDASPGITLQGTLPASIKDFTELATLQLSFQKLQGSLPVGLAGLAKLTYMWLSDNRFTGPVPELPWGQFEHGTA
jgi:hypothetical protein